MKNHSIFLTVLILSPLVFSFAFALDIYIPAVPHMIKAFNTTQTAVQITLSIFMLAVGMGQLIIGPISDQYGRHKILLFSTIAYLIGSLLCAISPNIYFLILARSIQALGGCGMLVVTMAIVRDCFSGNDSAKVYSFLNCGIGISPLTAPIIGSYLISWFNWRAGFIFLTVISIPIIMIVSFKITETLPEDKRIKFNLSIFNRYWSILKNRNFLSYVTSSSGALTVFFTFFSSSPYIIMNLLKVPQQNFGYYFFLVGCTFFVGSLISGKIAGRIGAYKTNIIGIMILLLSGLMMLLWYWKIGLTAENYLIPTMIAGVGGALMIGASPAGAMESFSNMAGSAAALFGSIEFVSGSIVGTFIMHWHIASTLPLAFTIIISASISLIATLLHQKHVPQ